MYHPAVGAVWIGLSPLQAEYLAAVHGFVPADELPYGAGGYREQAVSRRLYSRLAQAAARWRAACAAESLY